MNKIFLFLIIAFIIIFGVQQSNLIENKKVMDQRLGVATDENHLNWNNLQKYFSNLQKKIKTMIPASHGR